MEFRNDLSLDAPVARVWDALTDIESIAPCIPGFTLESTEGDEYRGVMKVRVGAVVVSYRTAIRFAELDAGSHRAVLSATGSELRGHGSVGATVTSSLTDEGGRTAVAIETDLHVTGKVAQMGRGVLVEVSNKLLGQFAACLEQRLSAEGETTADEEPPAPAPSPPVNLIAVGAGPLLRQLSPLRLVRALWGQRARGGG